MSDANPAGGRIRTPAAHDDLDMSGVDPLRINEVRRRVAVVKAYLALTEPTDADRNTHAVQLGLSVNQFLALVRAWREHGRAVAISGAGAAKGTPRPNSRRNLPVASKKAAQDVIATLGPEVSLVETVRLVKERCGAIRVAAPSRNTIWNMLMEHRRSNGTEGREGIVVCRCHVKMPVASAAAPAFPGIALVVHRPTGVILAAAMNDDPAMVSAIAEGIDREPGGTPVLIDAELAERVRPATRAPLLLLKPTAARTDTAKTLGRGFGAIDLIYQLSRAIRPEEMLRSRKDAAPGPDDARRIIAEQAAAHNAARGAEPPALSWLA